MTNTDQNLKPISSTYLDPVLTINLHAQNLKYLTVIHFILQYHLDEY